MLDLWTLTGVDLLNVKCATYFFKNDTDISVFLNLTNRLANNLANHSQTEGNNRMNGHPH